VEHPLKSQSYTSIRIFETKVFQQMFQVSLQMAKTANMDLVFGITLVLSILVELASSQGTDLPLWQRAFSGPILVHVMLLLGVVFLRQAQGRVCVAPSKWETADDYDRTPKMSRTRSRGGSSPTSDGRRSRQTFGMKRQITPPTPHARVESPASARGGGSPSSRAHKHSTFPQGLPLGSPLSTAPSTPASLPVEFRRQTSVQNRIDSLTSGPCAFPPPPPQLDFEAEEGSSPKSMASPALTPLDCLPLDFSVVTCAPEAHRWVARIRSSADISFGTQRIGGASTDGGIVSVIVFVFEEQGKHEIVVFDMMLLTQMDAAPVLSLLSDPSVRKICHDCRQCGIDLLRTFGCRLAGAWDTQIAEVLLRRVTLSEPAEYVASVRTVLRRQELQVRGGRRFGGNAQFVRQLAADPAAVWGCRPLPPIALPWAVDEVRHLPALRDTLMQKLATAISAPSGQQQMEEAIAVASNASALLFEYPHNRPAKSSLFNEAVLDRVPAVVDSHTLACLSLEQVSQDGTSVPPGL